MTSVSRDKTFCKLKTIWTTRSRPPPPRPGLLRPSLLRPSPSRISLPARTLWGVSLADIVSDLENRVHVREAQERTALYASVLNNVPIEIAVLGADHRYLYCNPEAIKNGAIRAWIIGKNDFEYCEYRGFKVEVAQKRWARFEEAVEKRGSVSWEETFVDARGNTLHHWRNMMPLFSPAGELEAVLGYGRDITERKRVRDELERSSRRVVNILESVSDTFFFLDTAWRFTYVNGKAEKFFGRPRGELLGENIWETFPQFLDYRFHQGCLGAAAQARPVTLEEYYPPTDRWFETRFYPAEEGVAVYLRNVSDRRALERTRKEAQRELERQVLERTAALEKARAELELANEKLLHDAFHDELTGLANRALFMDRLGVAIARNKRGGEGGFAVLFLDFDRFKLVNDSLGHTVGDALLVELSKRLRGCVRPGDTVARLGGDEFTILLEVDDLEGAVRTADRVQKALSAPFILAGHTLHSSASIGIVFARRRPQPPRGRAARRRYRHVPRQGAGPGGLPNIHARDARAGRVAPHARERPARRAPQGRVGGPLPAHRLGRNGATGRFRGAHALDSSRARLRLARRIHPHRGGGGPDCRARPLGLARGLRPG